MKVLIATSHTQSLRIDDYHFAVAGELVYLPLFDCDRDDCGCTRGFAGLSSSKATTTAMVIDRPDMTKADLEVAVADGLHRQGWLTEGWSEAHADILEEVMQEIEWVTREYPLNAIIERNQGTVRCRAVLHPAEHIGWAA